MPDNLGYFIKKHRQKAGLTQLQLADLAGVGKTVVFDLEHGKKTMQLLTLQKILQVLNISLKAISPLNKEELVIK